MCQECGTNKWQTLQHITNTWIWCYTCYFLLFKLLVHSRKRVIFWFKSAIIIKLRDFQSDLAVWFLYSYVFLSVALKNWPWYWTSWELKYVLKIFSVTQYLCSLPKRLPSCRGIPGPNICTSHRWEILLVGKFICGLGVVKFKPSSPHSCHEYMPSPTLLE